MWYKKTGDMIDFTYEYGEKFSQIEGPEICENTTGVEFVRADSMGNIGNVGRYSFGENDGRIVEKSSYDSIAINTAKGIGQVPFDLAENSDPGVRGIKTVVNMPMSIWESYEMLRKNYQIYSGIEFWKAEAVDVLGRPVAKSSVSLTAGYIQYLDTDLVPFALYASWGVKFGVDPIVDKKVDYLKKKYLKTDYEKNGESNKGIEKRS